ncbi:hypothetical protein DENSPDRAFT_853507 [Dentipellis sp. KUC8613]|nr:hypothetical protein DENSPDRAFT_853507 [Dentipellis sp. KUC8613]
MQPPSDEEEAIEHSLFEAVSDQGSQITEETTASNASDSLFTQGTSEATEQQGRQSHATPADILDEVFDKVNILIDKGHQQVSSLLNLSEKVTADAVAPQKSITGIRCELYKLMEDAACARGLPHAMQANKGNQSLPSTPAPIFGPGQPGPQATSTQARPKLNLHYSDKDVNILNSIREKDIKDYGTSYIPPPEVLNQQKIDYNQGAQTPKRSQPSHQNTEPESDSNNQTQVKQPSVKQMIKEQVGNDLTKLPEIKGIKIHPPASYTGDDSINKFEEWLNGLLLYLQAARVSGPGRNDDQIMLMGTTLKGQAADWYHMEVKYPNRVCFIHEATAQEAVNQFRKAKYSRADGSALVYYNTLMMYASRMIQHPDAYTFKLQFLEGLPYTMVSGIMMHQNISAEYSTMEEILEAIKIYEGTQRFIKGIGHSSDAKDGKQSTRKTESTSTIVDERSEQEDEQPQDEPPEPITEVEDNDLEPNEAYADEQEAVGSQYDLEYELEEFEEYDRYDEADSDNDALGTHQDDPTDCLNGVDGKSWETINGLIP